MNTGASARLERLTVFLLASLAVLAVAVRIPSVAQPLGIDQGLWSAVARGLFRGQVLYRDLWDQKPPGIFLLYLTTFRVLGWSASSVAWLDLIVSAATAGLIFAAVRRLSDRLTGTLAAALYLALTIPAWLYGHGGFLERAVNESHIGLLVAASAWCAARAAGRKPTAAELVGLGACAGAATVFKPNAGIYLLALLAWAVLYCREVQEPLRAKRIVGQTATVGLASLIVPACIVGWLWHHGIVCEGWVGSVQYNLMYIAPAAGAPPHWLAFTKAIWGRTKTDPLWLAGGLGALVVGWNLLRTKRVAPLPALASAWGAAAAVAIYANGAWLFNNYFVQALPPLSIMTAWLLSGVRRRASVHASAAWAAMVLMAVLLVSRGYAGRITRVALADLDVLRGRSTRTAYLDQFGDYGTGRGYSARANDELKAYIQAHTGPNDRVYVFGINAVEVYFTADRLAAQRFLRVNYFIPGSYPDPAYRLDAVVRDLDSSRPALIVFERLHSNSELGRITDGLQQNPVVVPLLASYRFQTQIEDFAVYGRIK